MLKLKKIHILGFKSFCDRTEVTLAGAGIAVVVGPNGCGKSNILDGVTWVLGEQSAKTLRGTHMQDLIFAGTRERKPLGMAEVTLTMIDPGGTRGPFLSSWRLKSITRRLATGMRKNCAAAAQPKPKTSSPTSSRDR